MGGRLLLEPRETFIESLLLWSGPKDDQCGKGKDENHQLLFSERTFVLRKIVQTSFSPAEG